MKRPLTFRALPDVTAACARLRKLKEPAELRDLDALGPEDALRLLDCFLHDPEVSAPLEPFAALVQAALTRTNLGLWDLHPPQPEEFLRRLPEDHPECLACPAFPVCEGYGAWAGSCPTWKALVPRIAQAARELRHREAEKP